MGVEEIEDGDGLYLRLEVPPGASQEEIARSYRRLAQQSHPDAHPCDPDAARRFREITEAYEVLSDSERRAQYDRRRRRGGLRAELSGPPISLGAPTGPVPLRVGPVRVDGVLAGAPPSGPVQQDLLVDELRRLLLGLLDERWRW